MTNYIISYDITNDRLRQKTAKTLQAKGCKRLQKSVFLAPGYRQKELQSLRQQLNRILQSPRRTDRDTILCWPVSNLQLADMLWNGDQQFFAKLVESGDWLIC